MRRLSHRPACRDRRAWAAPLAGAAVIAVVFTACTSPGPDTALRELLAEVRPAAVTVPAEPFRDVLSLDAALARADAASEEVVLLTAAVDVAAKERLMAGDMRDPELRLGYGASSSDGDRLQTTATLGPLTGDGAPRTREAGTLADDQTAYAIALRIFPPNPWVRADAIAAGTAATYAAIDDLRAAQWELHTTIRSLFVQIHFQAQALKVYREMTEVYGAALKVARERTRQGHGTVDDVMATSRRYLAAIADREMAQRAQAQAKAELAQLVAVPVEDLSVSMSDRLLKSPQIADANADQLAAQALDYRRDLAAMHWRTVQAKAEYDRARADRIPWFAHVQGGYGVSDSTGETLESSTGFNSSASPQRLESSTTLDDEQQTEWSIEAAIGLTFIPGINHERDVSLARYRSAELQEAKARERIGREIRDALTAVKAVETARQRYAADTRELTDDMEAALHNVEAATALDPLDVARMREQILESRRIKIESEMEYHLAVIRLEEVLGLRLKGR